jgi:hypothetical protein
MRGFIRGEVWANQHVIFGIPGDVQGIFRDFDPAQPLDAGRTEAPGHHQPSREPMITPLPST